MKNRPRLPLGAYYQLLIRRGLLAPAPPPGADLTRPVALVSCDSRAVIPGTLFVCKGAAFRPQYLRDAAERGADLKVALEERRADLQEDMSRRREDYQQRREERAAASRAQLEELRARLQAVLDENSFGRRRLLSAFPGMRSLDHRQALERLRRRMEKRKKRR